MREIFFHEDDFCQIQLLPISAEEFCQIEMGIIERFSAEHKTDFGWTDIYLRRESPAGFESLNVRVADLKIALEKHLAAFDRVQTGYSSYREECENVFAWGEEDFTIFGGVETKAARDPQAIVQAVWLSAFVSEEKEIETAVAALQSIPQAENLLLADWSWGVIVKLSDAPRLKSYFAGESED